jgi:deoxyribose-phosphate aldolase
MGTTLEAIGSPAHGATRVVRSLEVTRLGFGLTEAAALDAVRSASEIGAGGVCLPIRYLRLARAAVSELHGWTPDLVTVANFPHGDSPAAVVEVEARKAATLGADHIDVVVPSGLVMEGRWDEVEEYLRAVRHAAEDAAGLALPIKVILESRALPDDVLRGAAEAAVSAGAKWLKTSTGFHPAGGATVEHVRLLRAIAPEGVGVKASGGVRTLAAVQAMLDAGADRIGTSSEAAIAQALAAGVAGVGEACGLDGCY